MKLITTGSLLGLAFLALSIKPASAHHSFDAEYDANRTATLTGFVTKLDWINPHAFISITFKDEHGAGRNFTVELGRRMRLPAADGSATRSRSAIRSLCRIPRSPRMAAIARGPHKTHFWSFPPARNCR